MAFGLGVLRLQPDIFWSMTLTEVFMAYKGYFRIEHHRQQRQVMDELMRLYPDK
jgi:uncharacterized phage protein (TIGR02216 family)